tara:strand:+ start:1285 stop:1839 length:555 start_codon:yes stop_codon:yes gene_type:complete
MKNKLNKERVKKINFYLLTLILFFGCSSNDEVDVNLSSLTYDNEIYNPQISIYQNERVVISATSKKLLKDEGKDALLSGMVKSKFFNEDGNHISTLYSDSATIENITNNLKAFGNVKVISDSGFILLSNRILWNNQYKLVTSQDSVIFTTPSEDTLYGIGFESDIDLTHAKVYKPFGIVKEKNK